MYNRRLAYTFIYCTMYIYSFMNNMKCILMYVDRIGAPDTPVREIETKKLNEFNQSFSAINYTYRTLCSYLHMRI